ncbi:hypothetical protein LIER_00950 [Lithospermum erythrorhizon]|uniref:Transmembrane protein n=1 Tax=Lithospermum erythrorhizon TaxID=34254 RepID=A0AAV3NKE9_LITER
MESKKMMIVVMMVVMAFSAMQNVSAQLKAEAPVMMDSPGPASVIDSPAPSPMSHASSFVPAVFASAAAVAFGLFL